MTGKSISARIILHPSFVIGAIDDRLFGSFVEHLGRSVYGGIYESGHPTADADGLRGDVADLTKELGPTLIRYPGGNFVSGYRWEDGVGPRSSRTIRPELAWRSIETNEFGTGEFMRWCRRVGVQPMMAVNLGTRGIEDATRLLEYCNLPGGTELSELRRAHGSVEPYGVKLWCLGNEMDGPWQIGRKTAEEYGRLAAETANAMRMVDPSLELVACGSSYRAIETFGEWERTVLEHCYGRVDYLSLHTYYSNAANNGGEFLARSDEMDVFIKEVLAICDSVKARKRSNKTVNLSFDEWNVWFHTLEDDKKVAPWQRAPRLLEDVYTAEDATLVGGMLITLLNNADRVKIACLAQLVNVIAPIMTETGGRAWRQTIFHPFALTAAAAKGGTTLRQYVESDRYDAGSAVDAPFLASSCVKTRDGGLAVFAVNRSYDKDLELSIEFPGLDAFPTRRWTTLKHDDPKATNTADRPNEVAPQDAGRVSVAGNIAKLALPPHSWNLIQFAPSP